jgi:hypothetical protein
MDGTTKLGRGAIRKGRRSVKSASLLAEISNGQSWDLCSRRECSYEIPLRHLTRRAFLPDRFDRGDG